MSPHELEQLDGLRRSAGVGHRELEIELCGGSQPPDREHLITDGLLLACVQGLREQASRFTRRPGRHR